MSHRDPTNQRAYLAPTLAALAVCALVVAGVELRYRSRGGFPALWPGQTVMEFQWKTRRANPERTVFAVGDSRVGWGFSEDAFDEGLAAAGRGDLRGINAALPAADVSRIVFRLLEQEPDEPPPGTLLINFSAGSFYVFSVGPGPVHADLKLQDVLDDRLDGWLANRVNTWGVGGPGVWDDIAPGAELRASEVQVAGRTVFPDGFVNAAFERRDRRPHDPATYQLESYTKWYSLGQEQLFPPALTARFPERRARLVGVLGAALGRGWRVVLTRLPLGPRMRALEAALPPAYAPELLAEDLGLEFLDYLDDPRTRGLTTLDESHLDPASARAMSRILGADLAELLPTPP